MRRPVGPGACNKPVQPLGTVQLYAPDPSDAVQVTPDAGRAQKVTLASGEPLLMLPEMLLVGADRKLLTETRVKLSVIGCLRPR